VDGVRRYSDEITLVVIYQEAALEYVRGRLNGWVRVLREAVGTKRDALVEAMGVDYHNGVADLCKLFRQVVATVVNRRFPMSILAPLRIIIVTAMVLG
jgi:hypothetical protein